MKTFSAEPYELTNLRNDSFNGVYLSTSEAIAYYNSIHKDHMPILETKDRVYFLSFSIYFRKNSCLTKPFDRQLGKYTTNGLIDQWTSTLMHKKTKASSQLTKIEALNFHQIQGVVVLTIAMYAFSAFMFCIELLSMRIASIRKIVGFLTFEGGTRWIM